ncbi:MAG: DUF5131 family protein [Desulfuromonadales bacterium]|nr:DUF5131 family protein [Desulfuromonadales bacterium]
MISPDRLGKGLYWQRAWKLVEGCTKVSPGCDNCWSEQETGMRAGHPNEKIRGRAQSVIDPQTGFDGRITCREDNLDLPLRTKTPTVWAVWNDLYHEDVPLDFICNAIQTMDRARRLGHVFLVLTKRSERMGNFLSAVGEPIPDHVWHGVTTENQDQANERAPFLWDVPGKTFLSIEPMLEEIDLYRGGFSFLHNLRSPKGTKYKAIDAVLLGGESGKNARPMHPDWARSVRDQCAAAGVPFFFKQWGEWGPEEMVGRASHRFPEGVRVSRVGKKAAGRILDSRLHDDLPWVKP